MVVLAVVGIALMVLVPSSLLLFFGAFVFANSAYQWTSGKKWYILALWGLILGAGLLFMTYFGSEVSANYGSFMAQLKQEFTSVQQYFQESQIVSSADWQRVMNSEWTQKIFQPLGSVFSIFGLTALLFVVAFFMSFELERLQQIFRSFVGQVTRKKTFLKRSEGSSALLHTWVENRLLSMLIVTVLTYVGLLFVGLDYALSLSIAAGLLSFIPNLGPILGFIPALLLAIPQGQELMLMVTGLYGLVQLLESNVITPLIFKNALQLPVSLTFFFQLVFGSLFGFLGLTFAVPLGLILMHLLQLLPKKS